LDSAAFRAYKISPRISYSPNLRIVPWPTKKLETLKGKGLRYLLHLSLQFRELDAAFFLYREVGGKHDPVAFVGGFEIG
jgi:hypothetical protein